MSERVCAVVVTYNRQALLRECLDALLAQTRPVDKILIIDNASTDGTSMRLNETGYLRNDRIEYVLLEKNVGGAGGFHEGFKRSFEQGYDWLWVMDDDGIPDAASLQKLLAPREALFKGPLILDKEDEAGQRLAFDLFLRRAAGELRITTRQEAAEAAVDGLIWNYLCPFNGVLVSREVVERIGFPKKDMFLWGDEWDYFHRVRRAKIPTATVVDAIFRHPINRTEMRNGKIWFFKYVISYTDNPLRNYLLIRNHAYIAHRHYSIRAWVKHTLAYLAYYSKNPEQLKPRQVLKYSLEGLRGDLRGHLKFLETENK